MPLLDIEKSIKSEKIGSRFRLVNIASQRARDLNMPKENSLPQQSLVYSKITTNALNEVIKEKIEFTKTEEE